MLILDCHLNGEVLRGSAVFNLSSSWHYQKKSHFTHPWNRRNDTLSQDTKTGLQRPFNKSVITFLWRLHLEFWSHADKITPSFWSKGHRLYPMRLAQRGPLWSVRSTIHFKQTMRWKQMNKRDREHERKLPFSQGQSFTSVISARCHSHKHSLFLPFRTQGGKT